jgi:hypothetical protein
MASDKKYMKIYFAGSIRAGRDDAAIYEEEQVVKSLLDSLAMSDTTIQVIIINSVIFSSAIF